MTCFLSWIGSPILIGGGTPLPPKPPIPIGLSLLDGVGGILSFPPIVASLRFLSFPPYLPL